jgi:hypothetical protein
LPIGVNHRRCHIARIAKRRSPSWSGISASPATGPAVSHGIVRAGARPTACMVLGAADFDDDRGNGGRRERGLDLPLGIACCAFFLWQTRICGWRRCAHGAGGRGWLGELRCQPAEGDGLRRTGPRSPRPDGRLADRRAVVVAKRVGTHRAQAEENKYRPALHR